MLMMRLDLFGHLLIATSARLPRQPRRDHERFGYFAPNLVRYSTLKEQISGHPQRHYHRIWRKIDGNKAIVETHTSNRYPKTI